MRRTRIAASTVQYVLTNEKGDNEYQRVSAECWYLRRGDARELVAYPAERAKVCARTPMAITREEEVLLPQAQEDSPC